MVVHPTFLGLYPLRVVTLSLLVCVTGISMCSDNCIADCPHSGARVRIPLRQPDLGNLGSFCPRVNRTLRIAYNNESMPYFDLKQGRADIDTLEGAVLQIFIDRHNVTPEYMYGNYEWGSLDPDTGQY